MRVPYIHRLLILALVIVMASMVVSRPVMAAAEVAFDPNGNPNANPDFSFPAGATIYFVVTLDSGCSSAQIYWGDGSSDTGSSSTGVVHFTHQYSDAGTYPVNAVDMCDGQSLNTLDVVVEGLSFPINIYSASFPVSVAAAIGGFAIMALANPRVKGSQKRAKGSLSGLAGNQSPSGRKAPAWGYKRPVGYTAGPAQPTGQTGGVPSPISGGVGYSVDLGRNIGMPIGPQQGIPITGVGASVATPEVSPLPYLNAVWGPNGVTLTWGQPQFDQNQYSLLGYQVSILTYGPNNTMPVQTVISVQPPGPGQVNLPFDQTFRYNSGGDIAGFRVDPIFGKIVDGTQTVGKGSGLVAKFGSSVGTFGL